MIYTISKKEMDSLTEKNINWNIHCVCSEDGAFKKNMCDYHTHGLNKYNSLEFQIVIFINSNLAGYILNMVGMLCQNGYRFHDEDILYGLFKDANAPIRFVQKEDSEGVPILRIWIPDDNHCVNEMAEYPLNKQGENPYTY